VYSENRTRILRLVRLELSFEAELGEKAKGRSLRIKREFTTIPKFKPREPG